VKTRRRGIRNKYINITVQSDMENTLEYSFVIFVAIFIAPYLHEGSHWLVVWMGGGKPKFNYIFWKFVPNAVKIREIENIHSDIIRASGFAPIIWVPVGVISWSYFLIELTPLHFLVALLPTGTLLMTTEADALAFRDPEAFRRKAQNNEIERNPLFIPNSCIPEWLPQV